MMLIFLSFFFFICSATVFEIQAHEAKLITKFFFNEDTLIFEKVFFIHLLSVG